MFPQDWSLWIFVWLTTAGAMRQYNSTRNGPHCASDYEKQMRNGAAAWTREMTRFPRSETTWNTRSLMLVFTWAGGAHWWGHRVKGVQVLWRTHTQGDIQPCPIPGKSRVPLSTCSSWLKKPIWKHTAESIREGALLKKRLCLFLRDTKPREPPENNVFAATSTWLCHVTTQRSGPWKHQFSLKFTKILKLFVNHKVWT